MQRLYTTLGRQVSRSARGPRSATIPQTALRSPGAQLWRHRHASSKAPGPGEPEKAGTESSAASQSKETASESGDSSSSSSSPTEGVVPDRLAGGTARGRTGGGRPLESSSENAPPEPKILNAAVSSDKREDMTEEQRREVDEHNRDFEKRHDRAPAAGDDKVDKKFWSQ